MECEWGVVGCGRVGLNGTGRDRIERDWTGWDATR